MRAGLKGLEPGKLAGSYGFIRIFLPSFSTKFSSSQIGDVFRYNDFPDQILLGDPIEYLLQITQTLFAMLSTDRRFKSYLQEVFNSSTIGWILNKHQ